jgi:hypothetical protein
MVVFDYVSQSQMMPYTEGVKISRVQVGIGGQKIDMGNWNNHLGIQGSPVSFKFLYNTFKHFAQKYGKGQRL